MTGCSSKPFISSRVDSPASAMQAHYMYILQQASLYSLLWQTSSVARWFCAPACPWESCPAQALTRRLTVHGLSYNVSDTLLGKREGPAVGKVFCQSAVDFVYIFSGSLSFLFLASLSPPSAPPPSPCMTAIRCDAQDCVSPAKVHGRALHKDMPGPVHLACAPLRQRVHRTGVSTSVAAFAAAAASLAEIV